MTKQNDQLLLPLHYRLVATTLTVLIAWSPALAAAAPPLPAPAVGTLPQLRGVKPGSNGAVGATVTTDASRNTLTVTQNQGQANVTVDWNKFDIGAGATVRFYQGTGTPGISDWKPNSSYAALNRIYDANPSQIYGNLQADGKIFLINRNGILFGPGSQVNVHQMAASALNMVEDDFQKGLLRFTTYRDENQQQAGLINDDVSIANFGMITTDSGGGVFMVGPQVSNAGTITAPVGRVKLVGVRDSGSSTTAGSFDVDLTKTAADNDLVFNPAALFGQAVNEEGGKILAESGRVELAGGTVRQNGLIRAVSAVRQGGQIFLTARDLVATGAKSLTESPVGASTEKVDQSFPYNGGAIVLAGPTTQLNPEAVTASLPLARIEHSGAISAPSGQVTLKAAERVFLENGSSIDVSGLWVDQSAAANLLEVQLNSVELRDDYGQKTGAIKGEKIQLDGLSGSAIGLLSGTYLAASKTARERSTTGGKITIGDENNRSILQELVVKQGAELRFAGGGYKTAAGTIAETMLLSGNQLYSLSNAPQWLNYKLIGSQKKVYQRFGITETYSGLYYGGVADVGQFAPAREIGSNAGILNLYARLMALDGSLHGDATVGQFQTAITAHASINSEDATYQAYQVSVARGLERPAGGTLRLGVDQGTDVTGETALKADSVLGAVVVKAATVPLRSGFTFSDEIGRQSTELSAATVNGAGLGRLEIFSNSALLTEKGAELALLPGGSFIGRARRIEHQGAIDIPGGKVELTLRPNITSYPEILEVFNPEYQPLVETIYLANGSRISAAGEVIDNSTPGAGIARQGLLAGGSIQIQDLTEPGTTGLYAAEKQGHAVNVANGAVLNVDGGYRIDLGNKVTGGDAGSLELKAPTLSLGGALSGLALAGKKGGELKLHAGEVNVAPVSRSLPTNTGIDAEHPDYLQGQLVLGEHRLDQTGFTRISLTAIDNVSFSDGAVLTPSLARLAMPVPGAVLSTSEPAAIDNLGGSSLNLTAGVNIYPGVEHNKAGPLAVNTRAMISVPAGSALRTAPGGSIELKAPIVDLAGVLETPGAGGKLEVTATGGIGIGQLTVRNSARILATGYVKPTDTAVAGLPSNVQPLGGGAITLSSGGDLTLEIGALVDLSGSVPVELLSQNTDGSINRLTTASDPGSLILAYGRNLTLDGTIVGKASLAGLRGGTLEVRKTQNDLILTENDLTRYQASGFDALTFASSGGAINLPTFLDVRIGRSLTLDARELRGAGSGEVKLHAPWIKLVNSSQVNVTDADVAAQLLASGSGRLSLSASSLDLEGSMIVAGYRDAELTAARDIRLADRTYADLAFWDGKLVTSGNLTMTAARIYPSSAPRTPEATTGNSYPTLASNFSISSRGMVTTLPGSVNEQALVYSAGGSLSITADQGINHQGYLTAPMGSITLEADTSRVYLAEGSRTVVSGASAVPYGVDNGTAWYDKFINSDNTGNAVTSAPIGTVSLRGNEVVVKDGAIVDLRGGGTVYSSLFQPALEGSYNPLSVQGLAEILSTTGSSTGTFQVARAESRYVILTDNSLQLPGYTWSYLDSTRKLKNRAIGAVHLQATRLDDGTMLPEGTYSLLPEQFAFLPGARIISDLGITTTAGDQFRTSQGYQVVTGYDTILDTTVRSPQFKGYAIRPATELLREGNFTVKQLTAGNGGDFTLEATAGGVMAGTLRTTPLAGYQAGTMTWINPLLEVKKEIAALSSGFDFATPLPDSGLQFDATVLANRGKLILGDSVKTTTLTVRKDAELTASSISLNARDSITVEKDAKVLAPGTESGSGIVAINRTFDATEAATLPAPVGSFTVAEKGLVQAANGIRLNLTDMSLQGKLLAEHSFLSVYADTIAFVPDSYVKQTVDKGLFLTESRWQEFAGYEELGLHSRNNMLFTRDVALTTAGDLTLEAKRFSGASTVKITAAQNLTLLSAGDTLATPSIATGGSLSFDAQQITVTPNNKSIVFDGFAGVTLTSGSDLLLQGAGTMKAAGTLELQAARVATSFYRDAANTYQTADFKVDSNDVLTISRNSGSAGSDMVPGGTLRLLGKSIKDSGLIELPAGQVLLTATGSDPGDGIFLTDGAEIRATGAGQETAASTVKNRQYAYYSGGQIALRSDKGEISLAEGTRLDVSAVDQGTDRQVTTDAGSITLSAPNKGVVMNGTLAGLDNKVGKGGSFGIDTTTLKLSDLSSTLTLDRTAKTGGFTERLEIRARQGNLDVADLSAHEITVAADDGLTGNGRINVTGTVTATADAKGNGGRVEMNARNDLTVTGSILATGKTAGGEISLGSATGVVTLDSALQNKGVLDVSGGTDGVVHLRALRNTNTDPLAGPVGVNMVLNGTITGAGEVVAEAFKVYPKTGNILTADINGLLSDTATYMGSDATIKANLLTGLTLAVPGVFHFRPGIEVQSSSDLTLAATVRVAATGTAGTWDLSATRYNNEPGILTLRAAGNLTISADLVDHPTIATALNSGSMLSSWGINLVAGADLAAASPLAVKSYTPAMTNGDLTIGSGKVVYSENGPLNFAAARNASLTTGKATKYMINDTMTYNLGSYGGAVRGQVGNTLSITNGGAIQTALGAIDLKVGGNLDLGLNASLGGIRTTGEYAYNATRNIELAPGSGKFDLPEITNYWMYRNGGAVTLDVAGAITGNLNVANEWDAVYLGDKNTNALGVRFFPNPNSITVESKYLAASYAKGTLGIATMAGGDIAVRTGGAFTAPIGAFGTTYAAAPGDLRIIAGGDLNGRFRIMDGSAILSSGGSFGAANSLQVIELADANVVVVAQGDVHLGAVLNPDNARGGLFTLNKSEGKVKWNLTYTPTSAISTVSLAGNLTYYGESEETYNNYSTLDLKIVVEPTRQRILPATASLIAAKNVEFMKGFALAPAQEGNLTVAAGNDIKAPAIEYTDFALIMADLPTSIYGFQTSAQEEKVFNGNTHLLTLHNGDTAPVIVRAGNDISNLRLLVNKAAEISAGRDIVQLDFIGQNTGAADVTSITAGRDLLFAITPLSLIGDGSDPRDQLSGRWPGIIHGGPGVLLVQAGQGLDLGNARGIKAVGTSLNSSLTGGESTLMILTGAKETGLAATDMVPIVKSFFEGTAGLSAPEQVLAGSLFKDTNGLLQAGKEYSGLKAKGEATDAAARLAQARQGIVMPLFAEPSVNQGQGGIAMVDSQISGGSGNIYVMARSTIDVGRSTLGSGAGKAATGISTNGGGNVFVYAGGDINVNESRIMTYMGGNIAIWSDRANINAGRGSKTTLSASPPEYDPATQTYKFVPPAAGSGVRGVTFDPDGLEGPQAAPAPGDIDMFAPDGNIDAGEAGIVGGKITLAATEVLNSKNITASAGSVGVSAGADSSVSIGALAGAGSVTDSSKMIEQTSGTGSAKDAVKTTTQVMDDFMSKFLDIKVLNFDLDSLDSKDEKEKDKEKERK